jgi:hypothetical protein
MSVLQNHGQLPTFIISLQTDTEPLNEGINSVSVLSNCNPQKPRITGRYQCLRGMRELNRYYNADL